MVEIDARMAQVYLATWHDAGRNATGTNLPDEQLASAARAFAAAHCPDWHDGAGWELVDHSLASWADHYLFEQRSGDHWSGGRLSIGVHPKTAEPVSYSFFLPVPHPPAAQIDRADAEARALTLLREIGPPNIEVVRSRLYDSSPIAPAEGPVWMVEVREVVPAGSPAKQSPPLGAILDAVTGGSLLPKPPKEKPTEE